MVATPTDIVNDARTALVPLTERQRLQIAIALVNDCVNPRSAPDIDRLINVAHTSRQALQRQVIVDGAPEDICPAFLSVFQGFYDLPGAPSVETAYRAAVTYVAGHKVNCSAPTLAVVQRIAPRLVVQNRSVGALEAAE